MSTGLYTHITRSPGTIVTAVIYNTDHQAHLQNDIPTSTGAVSDTLTQFRATQDPAPAGVPTPVISIGDEIEQHRFVLQDVAGDYNAGTPPTYWYIPVTAAAVLAVGHGARVHRSTSQTISTKTQTPIVMDVVDYDTGVIRSTFDPFFSFSHPTRLTASVSGLYQITGFASWDGIVRVGSVITLFLRYNGLTILAGVQKVLDGLSAVRGFEVGTQYIMPAGSYVELLAYENTGNSLALLTPVLTLQLLRMSATFPSPTLFALSFTESGSGTGVITANLFDDFTPTSINCPGTCSENFVNGTQLWLHATPDGGSSFTTWSGDVPIGHETDNPVLVTMDQARTIDAQFDSAAMVTVHFRTSQTHTGKLMVDDGTGPVFYSVTSGVDDFKTIQTSVVPDMTAVTFEALESDGVTHYCPGTPGPSMDNGLWSVFVKLNCADALPYQITVTVNFSENDDGNITWNAFP